MQDIIQGYKQYQKKRFVSLVGFAFLFAVSANVVWFGAQKITKTSLQESQILSSSFPTDLILTSYEESESMNNNEVVLLAGNEIYDANNLTFSLVFNPEKLEITNVFLWEEVQETKITQISNMPGVTFITLSFPEATSFKTTQKILKIQYKKMKNQETTLLMSGANFSSKNEYFKLTTQGKNL